jgi:hypothetical protein
VHVDDKSVASVCASYPGGVPQYISGGLVTNELRKRRIEQRQLPLLRLSLFFIFFSTKPAMEIGSSGYHTSQGEHYTWYQIWVISGRVDVRVAFSCEILSYNSRVGLQIGGFRF